MPEPSNTQGSGLEPNVASLLCYICLPITSIVFMVLEKQNKNVQFHAWQGTLFGIGMILLFFVLQVMIILVSAVFNFLGILLGLLHPLLMFASMVLWLICLLKAYQGENWRIPVIGDIAAQKAGLND